MDLYSDAAKAYFSSGTLDSAGEIQCHRCKYRRGADGCKKKSVRSRGPVPMDVFVGRVVCPFKKLKAEPDRPRKTRVFGSPDDPV